MSVLQQLGAKHVAPEVAKEGGTYALYGAVDAKNPNIMRVLEFYENDDAYRIHAASDGFCAYDEARRPYLKGVKILEAAGIALEQKDSGVGTSVHMDLIQVKPECLEAYAQRLAEEIRRAAADDEHVVGLYATAEKDNPARIHTMGIFTDEAGYEAYISSPAYQAFRRDTQDMIIMQTALAEILTFPTIPTSVSLNEYIDAAKYYSTPKSGNFINGILDAIVNELNNEGTLLKD